MTNLFKKDSLILGMALGLLVPPVLFIIIYYSSLYLVQINKVDFVTGSYINKIQLLSICLPLILFRYYMKGQNFERTGRGIILVIFIYTLVYFYFTLIK